ncbi:hypothetical protein HPB49_006276 [Dermacentor silvarum]|uniref:Uncharacterized protein n=1 Tax=Dermacentor silvarum TaxID=543639 RepID=A0ACB8C7K1_DERSI|nr:hypothetical protein HPB49_006276 [Dermacentor silvarum]
MPECDAAPCSDDAHPPGRPRVAVYVRAALPHARVPTDHLCNAMIDCVAVTVRVRGTNASVASVYVRAGARRAYYSLVVRLTALLSPDTVVCGDFNVHHRDWGSARSNARGGELSSAIAAAGLTVLNSREATFVRRDGVATVIDLALVSERCCYSWQRAPDTARSDHYPITLCPTRPSRGATRVYAVVRWPLFREIDYFAHIAECGGRATTRVIVPAGTTCPDIKLLNVRAARRRAHWAGLCSSLAKPRNQHRGWRVLSALLNPRTPRFPVLAIAVAHGNSERQLADAFAAAATAPLLGVPAVALRALYVAVFVRGGDQSTHAQAITSLCEEDFTFHELQRVLCLGRRRSAPGQDGVTHQMLRNLDEDKRHLLLDAFNGVLRSGCLPDTGALSRVYALPLCNLRPHLWRRIDGDHRRVLRMCHGLPGASRVAETLVETGGWPVSLTADLRALGHLERLSRAPGAGPMLSYLRELPKCCVGVGVRRVSLGGYVLPLFFLFFVFMRPVLPGGVFSLRQRAT